MIIDNPNINATEMRVGVDFSLNSTDRLGKVTDDRLRAGVKESSKVCNTTLILPTPDMIMCSALGFLSFFRLTQPSPRKPRQKRLSAGIGPHSVPLAQHLTPT